MLDLVRNKITNIITQYETVDTLKPELVKLINYIKKYQDENKNTTDVHRAFAATQRYAEMYRIAVNKYMVMAKTQLEDRSFQIQEILCLISLITSIITDTIRKYNTGDDKNSSIGKHLRRLSEDLEYYKGEKITRTTILKSITTMISDKSTDKKVLMQQALLDKRNAEEENRNA